MLPQQGTKDYCQGNILLSGFGNIRISDNTRSDEYETPQHLYFIDSESPIEEGCYVILPDNRGMQKMTISDMLDYLDSQSNATKKSICSTDKSLGLPGIPQSALQYYVEKQGKIDYFEVEMEENIIEGAFNAVGKGIRNRLAQNEYKLKLSNSGEVVVVLPLNPIEQIIYDISVQETIEHCNEPGFYQPKPPIGKKPQYIKDQEDFQDKHGLKRGKTLSISTDVEQAVSDISYELYPINIVRGQGVGDGTYDANHEARKAWFSGYNAALQSQQRDAINESIGFADWLVNYHTNVKGKDDRSTEVLYAVWKHKMQQSGPCTCNIGPFYTCSLHNKQY